LTTKGLRRFAEKYSVTCEMVLPKQGDDYGYGERCNTV